VQTFAEDVQVVTFSRRGHGRGYATIERVLWTIIFVRFVHFVFGSRYGDYLDAVVVSHQKGFVEISEDTFVCSQGEQ
jgi:hypothetical protein